MIRTKLKLLYERIFSRRLQIGLLQALPLWLASVATGLVAVAYTYLFNYSEHLLGAVMGSNTWLIFIVTPFSFLLAYLVVRVFAPAARGSGIPQVMAAIELAPKYNDRIPRLLSLRILVVKIASSLLMVFGGGAIGREGPTIQIAGSVFTIINRMSPPSWPKLSSQNYILTGAAAGLAAAFNTPLGGVVFAMEELAKSHIRFFRTALFSAVIIAGLTAQAMLGPYLYLGYPNVKGLAFSMFFAVALTAIICGIAGSLMSKAILAILRWKKNFTTMKNIGFVIIAGFVVALIAYYINDQVLGSGKSTMNSLLFGNNKEISAETVLMRIIGPIIAFSNGAAGGVFAPSLAAGASVGGYIATLFEIAGANANILILSGMVGFLTGVTRTPFTSAILVLEMTDRHSVIFHLLLAAVVSNVAALMIDRKSLYDHLKKDYIAEIKEEKTENIR